MDFKALADRLKGKGLDVAEEAAKVLTKETLAWLGEEVVKTENKFDDLLVPMIPLIERELMKAIDKIDGQVG